MLSAREFYSLQKMQKQGKLANNPRATALLNKVTETLNKTSQQHTNEAENILHPVLNNVQQKDSIKKKPKKKKKAAKSESHANQQQPSLDASKTAPTASSKISTETLDAGADHLSKNQRKRLRKKLSKQSTSAQAESTSKVSTQPSATGTKRQVPTPTSPSTEPSVPPNKKSRISPEPQFSPVKVVVEPKPKSIPVETQESPRRKSEENFIPADSVTLGQKELEAILSPISVNDFFAKYFEKQPLLIQRKSAFTNEWLTTSMIDMLLREERVMFSEHLDLAVYEEGRRYTLNPPGRAFPSIVWDHYNTGCSIRLLCPQVFFPQICQRLSLLQEYFGCFVGANAYLTPPGSQGFAPHYDDIEAFVLQLEGTKRWKVYAPRDESEKLARDPSPNFTQEELGKPILTATLKPGDVLYFPRGYIHQAETTDDTHSLHLTISTFQKHSWGDFLSKLLPIALQSAIETNVEFRKGLPIGFLRHVGGFSQSDGAVSKEKNKSSEATKCLRQVRAEVVSRLRMLADQLERQVDTGQAGSSSGASGSLVAPDPLLTAADLFATDLIAQSLPPQLNEEEQMCHVESQGERWSTAPLTNKDTEEGDAPKKDGVVEQVELEPDTKVRLVRWSAVRAVRTRVATATGPPTPRQDDDSSESDTDEDTSDLIAVYHSLSNTKVYKERPLDELALHRKLLPALDFLARQYPEFVSIEDFPLPNLDDRMNAAVGLYEAGLLITSEPLVPMDDEDYSSEEDEEQDRSSEDVALSSEEEEEETIEDDPTDSDDVDPDDLVDDESEDDEDDEDGFDELIDGGFGESDDAFPSSEESSESSPLPSSNPKQKPQPLAALPNPEKSRKRKRKTKNSKSK